MVSDLLQYIFEDTAEAPTSARIDALAFQFAGWLAVSPRFRQFAETYRDKIRKKARTLQGEDRRASLHAELETAYLLLQEPRFTVEYEKHGKQGGPDFAVTFRTRVHFNVEVTCLRSGNPALSVEVSNAKYKLANVICAKLSQLPPSAINIVAVIAQGADYTASDMASAMQVLHEKEMQKDDLFFAQRGLGGVRDFHKHLQRLSGILVRATDAPAALWINPRARHPIPGEIGRILQKS